MKEIKRVPVFLKHSVYFYDIAGDSYSYPVWIHCCKQPNCRFLHFTR